MPPVVNYRQPLVLDLINAWAADLYDRIAR